MGGGLAGMIAALEAAGSSQRLLLVCKSRVGNSGATLMAGSNFAAVLPDAEAQGDRVALHVEDTISAGAHINDPALVQILAQKAPEDLLYLEKLGVEFIKKEGRFDLRKPPGHRNLRTVFTKNPGFPLTIRGKSFTAPLRRIVNQRKILLLEGVSIVRIILEEGRVAGALGIRRKDGEVVGIECKTMIIASGGAGFLYEINTNPSDLTGDSYSLALEAGCSLRDMEFVQFYPCMYLGSPRVPIYSPILSDGAVLRNKDGERFLARYEPERMEQATRDAVSRAMFLEIQAGRGVSGGVYLDLTAIPDDLLSFRFPDLIELFKKQGIDLKKQWIRVAPSAHFFMGGFVIDERCQTSIPGLFAAGEATGGIHGANRLSGNGLSDPLVFGRIAGRQAVEYARKVEKVSGVGKKFEPPVGLAGEKISAERIEEIRRHVKHQMWMNVGIIRNGQGLQQALQEFEKWQEFMEERQAERKEKMSSYFEVRSMLISAQAVARSALFREESRGAHFREDFPESKPEWAKSVYARMEDGKIHASSA
ncbi:MAG: FAD-binding protein [Deltaproteobacteria bacterium]|nr:FAD-binding protein [Deltaproteobacteria bacterium]